MLKHILLSVPSTLTWLQVALPVAQEGQFTMAEQEQPIPHTMCIMLAATQHGTASHLIEPSEAEELPVNQMSGLKPGITLSRIACKQLLKTRCREYSSARRHCRNYMDMHADATCLRML